MDSIEIQTRSKNEERKLCLRVKSKTKRDERNT